MEPIISQQSEQSYSPLPEPKHFLNKKFIVTFVVLLLLGVGASAGIWFWFNDLDNLGCNFCNDSIVEIEDVTTSWKTYRNDQYGFEFKIPPEFELRTKPLERQDSWIDGYIPFPSDGNNTVVAVALMSAPKSEFPNTDLQQAFFAVRVMENSPCPKTQGLERTLGLHDINGNRVMFFESEGASVAAGHQQNFSMYANVFNGNCFILENIINTGGFGAVDGIESVKQYLVMDELYQILSTFKFTK